MPICIPIKDLRDTAKFSRLVETSPTPITITKNGYSKFVVMRSEDYDELASATAEAHLMQRIATAERERSEGNSAGAFGGSQRSEAKTWVMKSTSSRRPMPSSTSSSNT